MQAFRIALIAAVAMNALPVAAQQASFAYRLGKDTIAVEQYTRTPGRLVGELVRQVPTVLRLQYDVTLGADGRPTRAVVRTRQGDGTPIPNQPTELRLTFTADSVRRENVWPDSTATRTVAVHNALFLLTWPSVGTMELLAAAQRRAPADSFVGIGTSTALQWFRLTSAAGDTLRLSGGPYPFLLRFDAHGNMLMVDGRYSTNKVVATRSSAAANIAAIAAHMPPASILSARGTSSAGFGPTQSPVIVDYGRPKVRTRTVWGGALVPFDSVWRAGANAATHLATSRPLAFGDLMVPAGMYSLWIQHTRTGTSLIINRGTGQWGTQYDAAQDFGRVPLTVAPAPEFVEEFTITVRAIPGPGNRGAIDFAWGPSVATASFALKQ